MEDQINTFSLAGPYIVPKNECRYRIRLLLALLCSFIITGTFFVSMIRGIYWCLNNNIEVNNFESRIIGILYLLYSGGLLYFVKKIP